MPGTARHGGAASEQTALVPALPELAFKYKGDRKEKKKKIGTSPMVSVLEKPM